MGSKTGELVRALFFVCAFSAFIVQPASSAEIRRAPSLQNVTPSAQTIPSLRSVVPQSVNQGKSLQLTLTGSNLENNVQLDFGPGIQVNGSIKKLADISFQVNITVLPDAQPGRRDIKLIYGGRAVSTPAFINVLQTANIGVQGITVPSYSPSNTDIRSVAPSTLMQGQSYTLILTVSDFKQGMKVSFGEGIDVKAPIMTGNNITVNVTVAPNAPPGKHDVKIIFDGQQRNTSAFVTVLPSVKQNIPPPAQAPVKTPTQVFQVPEVSTVTPGQWIAGNSYHLIFNGKGMSQGMEISFGDDIKIKKPLSVLNNTMGEMEITVPLSAKGGVRNAKMKMKPADQWVITKAAATVNQPLKPANYTVAPVCQPINTVFVKGTIHQKTPEWGTVGGGEFSKSVGAPMLNDNILFTWKEKNPGFAEYYEFRVLGRDGKLLKTVRLDGFETVLFGKKVKVPPQTYFRPDAAFIQEITGLALKDSVQTMEKADKKLPKGQEGSSGVYTKETVQNTAKAPEGNLAKKDAFPNETALLWEVVGFREFATGCGFVAEQPAAKIVKTGGQSAITQPVSLTLQKNTPAANVGGMQKQEKTVLEVERSEQWPLSLPDRPTGIKACTAGGLSKGAININPVGDKCVYDKDGKCKTQKVKKPLGSGKKGYAEVEEKIIDPNNYPGDKFRLEGSFSLDRSPFAIKEEIKKQKAGDLMIDSGTGKFLNIVVDWGDGGAGSVIHPLNLTTAVTWKEKGSYGSDMSVKFILPDNLTHAYDRIGSFHIRIYMLSDDDMQKVNPADLAQSVDKNSTNPYSKLLGLSRASDKGNAMAGIADRAYMIFCKTIDIRPVEDTDATGPLHLEAINVTGFPGHETGQGGCSASEPQIRTAVKGALSPVKAESESKISRTGKGLARVKSQPVTLSPAKKIVKQGEIIGEATTCDESLIAEASLDYYGQGLARISWNRAGKTVRQEEHQVPPSEQRENLTRNPKDWPAVIVSTDPNLPNSGNLLSDNGSKKPGDHEVNVSAMVVVKPTFVNFGKYVEGAIDNSALRGSVNNALTRSGPKGETFKAGFLSPAAKASSGAPPVLYANDALPKLASPAAGASFTAMGSKPNYVASDKAKYRIKESDPKQPCTFVFADKDKGEFRISGLQGKVARQGTKYSGCGTLLVQLTKSADSTEEYPIPIEFSNWTVEDGRLVEKGTKLTVEPQKTISAPGLTGTLDKIEGTAGDQMTATLSMKLHDTLRVAGGTEKPHEWAGIKSRLYADGDWYAEKQKLPETFIGWSSYKILSDNVTIDLSRSKTAGTIHSLCGAGGNKWVGVHLGTATLIPYTMDLVPTGGWTPPAVEGWAITDEGLCGAKLISKPFSAKINEGSLSFDAIDVKAEKGTFTAIYQNMVVHVPWLDTDLKGNPKLQYQGGGEKGIVFALSGTAPVKDYGSIKMKAKNLSFTQEENIGWTVSSDTRFEFTAEDKKFSSFDVPGLFFGMDGRAYFEKGGTGRNIALGGPSVLGQTSIDLLSVDLDSSKGGKDRLKFTFNSKINLSKKMPAADTQVLYSIRRDDASYYGQGPVTAPFSLTVAFPPGQPSVEANIQPSYTGPSSGKAADSSPFRHYAAFLDTENTVYTDAPSGEAWPEFGDQYASGIPGSYDIALFGGSEDGDRFNGTLDLAMFGGPPVKAEFRLGYKGGEDYWITRATVGLGSSGITLTPYLSLYAIRGGLGYNFPIHAFKNGDTLTAVSPDMSGTHMFMAGMRVGAPSKFPYMLDGDFTVKLGVGARMDYRAWLMSSNHTGDGTFYGYFQYAGGNFDGMLAGKLSLMGNAVYVEVPENAATLHFGGGTWHLAAGKKEGPKLKMHLLIQDANGYFYIGDQGMMVGGGMDFYLNAGIGHISGFLDAGLSVTPQPAVSGHAVGGMKAKVCGFGICIGPSLTAGVQVSAMPVKAKAHACFEIDLGLYSEDICGNFSL